MIHIPQTVLGLMPYRPIPTKETPMLVVHHLNDSRSQRVLWLLEELELPPKHCLTSLVGSMTAHNSRLTNIP